MLPEFVTTEEYEGVELAADCCSNCTADGRSFSLLSSSDAVAVFAPVLFLTELVCSGFGVEFEFVELGASRNEVYGFPVTRKMYALIDSTSDFNRLFSDSS